MISIKSVTFIETCVRVVFRPILLKDCRCLSITCSKCNWEFTYLKVNSYSSCIGFFCTKKILCGYKIYFLNAVNGAWGDWTGYQSCSVTCGTGTQTRYRYCNSPHPAHDGLPCTGDDYQVRSCSPGSCGTNTHTVGTCCVLIHVLLHFRFLLFEWVPCLN